MERTWKASPFPAVESVQLKINQRGICLTLTLGIASRHCSMQQMNCGMIPYLCVRLWRSRGGLRPCTVCKCTSQSSDICCDTFPKALECVGENARRDEEVAIVVLASLKSSQISLQTGQVGARRSLSANVCGVKGCELCVPGCPETK